MDGDAQAVASGRPPSKVNYGLVTFPAARVDRTLHDGDTVSLGGVTLTAIKTPGHTAGCTTWTMPVREKGRTLRVMFPCSLTVAGNALVDNPGYPGIVGDFRRSFDRMAALRADILLPAHPDQIDLMARRDAAARGKRDAYVRPNELQDVVAKARAAFETELARQSASVTSGD
jgi:metallo-beta-lactamase class B